jgi:hypothetical protein
LHTHDYVCLFFQLSGDMVDSDADDDDDAGGLGGSGGSGFYEEGLVPLLMGLPGDLQTSASMLYDDEVRLYITCVDEVFVSLESS